MRLDFIGDLQNFGDAFTDVRDTMMRGEWHPVAINVKQTRTQKDISNRVQKQMNLVTLLIVLDWNTWR